MSRSGEEEGFRLPQAPDPALVGASAMVFVDDVDTPVASPEDAHHLLTVLRLHPGELVVVSDGRGAWASCRIAADPVPPSARGPVALARSGPVRSEVRPKPAITVGFVPVKGDRADWVVQKLTEIGVDQIVPLRSVRSVVRWEDDRAERTLARLRKVAREASTQCRRTWLPEVAAVSSLDELAALGESAAGSGPTTAGSGPTTAVPPRLALARPGGTPPSLDDPVVAIGPEGGWDEAELARFGTGPGLGPTVLRAETAAVALGTILCALRSGVVATLAQPRSVSETTRRGTYASS